MPSATLRRWLDEYELGRRKVGGLVEGVAAVDHEPALAGVPDLLRGAAPSGVIRIVKIRHS